MAAGVCCGAVGGDGASVSQDASVGDGGPAGGVAGVGGYGGSAAIVAGAGVVVVVVAITRPGEGGVRVTARRGGCRGCGCGCCDGWVLVVLWWGALAVGAVGQAGSTGGVGGGWVTAPVGGIWSHGSWIAVPARVVHAWQAPFGTFFLRRIGHWERAISWCSEDFGRKLRRWSYIVDER